MPNHCTNKVSIIGVRAHEFADAVNIATPHYPPQGSWDTDRKEPEPEPFSFHAIIPIPDIVLAAGYSETGYKWQCSNWGTKWGAYDYGPVKRGKNVVTYTFDTAWAPPLPVLAQASHRWGVLVALSYHEEYPSRGRHLFVGGRSKLKIDDTDSPERAYAKWHKEYFNTHGAWVRGLAKSKHLARADELYELAKKAQGGDQRAAISHFLGSL